MSELKNKFNQVLKLEPFNNEVDKTVDTAAIGVSVALCAALAIVLGTQNNYTQFTKVSILIALTSLTLSVFSSLWHISRFPKRIGVLRKETKDMLEHYAKGFTDYMNNFYKPAVLDKFESLVEKEVGEKATKDQAYYGKVDPKLLDKYIDEAFVNAKEQLKSNMPDHSFIEYNVAHALSNNLHHFAQNHLYIPLPEKFARVKLVLDILSAKTRYILFTVGVLSFVISIILYLFV